MTQPNKGVYEPWSIQTVIHARGNNGGITVYLIIGWIKGQKQSQLWVLEGYIRARKTRLELTVFW